jgi:uncharacterized protein
MMMEQLFELFTRQLQAYLPAASIKRYLLQEIDWNNRLIAIKGITGSGKTTFLLQYINDNLKINEEVLYVSLDNIIFAQYPLIDVVDKFAQNTGKYLFLDDIHKYPDWAADVKKIIEKHAHLRLVLAGSSTLEFEKDLSEYSNLLKVYDLHGLSFREFIELLKGFRFPVFKLSDILDKHISISQEIFRNITPLSLFADYLRHGYYPYFIKNALAYKYQLANIINLMIESDLPYCHNLEFKNIPKIKKLLYIIANSSPLRPNVTTLSEQTNATRGTVLQYLDFLKNAQIINLLKNDSEDKSILAKPEKIYLNNTNLLYTLSFNKIDIQNVRETFFYNQLMVKNAITSIQDNDFMANNNFIFDIGEKEKSPQLIKDHFNRYTIVDDIEIGFMTRIPLWLFGFLY